MFKIEVVQPDQQYIPEIGDVLWGAAADWAAPKNGEEPDPMRVAGLKLNEVDIDNIQFEIIPLNVIHPNPFVSLRWLGIDTNYFSNSAHNDPYTGARVYGVVPCALLTNNPKQYEPTLKESSCPFPDMVLDTDFIRSICGDILEISEVQLLYMGSGYTQGCSHFDGIKQRKTAKLKLSNNDWLFVYFWEWFNK